VIIISDTSPINNLAAIGALHLLKSLYGTVVIPEAVYRELTEPDFVVAGAVEVQTLEWIQVRSIADGAFLSVLRSELDPGESEAIALALELGAEQILIDERKGRSVAKRLSVQYTGTLGILLEAKNQALISSVKPLLDALIEEAGFWIAESLYKEALLLAQEEYENE